MICICMPLFSDSMSGFDCGFSLLGYVYQLLLVPVFKVATCARLFSCLMHDIFSILFQKYFCALDYQTFFYSVCLDREIKVSKVF